MFKQLVIIKAARGRCHAPHFTQSLEVASLGDAIVAAQRLLFTVRADRPLETDWDYWEVIDGRKRFGLLDVLAHGDTGSVNYSVGDFPLMTSVSDRR